VLDEKTIDSPVPHFQKFYMYRLLKKYNRVIYLDTDLVVTKNCPNLFDIVPRTHFGARVEAQSIENDSLRNKGMLETFKDYDLSKEYFNSGVMIVSRKHREMFNPDMGMNKGIFEQHQLNYNFQKLKFTLFDIKSPFNYFYQGKYIPDETERKKEMMKNYILHYPGSYDDTISIIKNLSFFKISIYDIIIVFI